MHSDSTTELPPVKELSAIAAENNPNRIAYGKGVDGREITWAEFDEKTSRLANGLRNYVGQGDRVAFLTDCSIEHVSLWKAAVKAGCVVSNVHTRASPETLRYCVNELQPRVLVVDGELSERAETVVREEMGDNLAAVVTTDEPRREYEVSMADLVADQPAVAPDVRVTEDDLVAVVWTSGTTGRPKGWCYTNRGLILKALKNTDMSRSSSVPQLFTPSFAAWYASTIPAMVANASMFFIRDWDAETYLQMIDERELTTAVLVPTMWREILRLDEFDAYDVSSLESIVASGERLDETTLERLRENVCENVTNGYAATEVLVTATETQELEGDRIESVGKPNRGTRVRVIEQGGPPDATKPPGEIGEIIVKGYDAAVWAWSDTERTENAFEDGWWYSGDLGYKDEEGFLFLEGRKDFMILSKGMKVFPTPAEERLNAHEGVEEAAVVGVDDEEYGEKVTALVHRIDPTLTADELDEWCLDSDKLARYERPREYRFVDEQLPRTASGKLDRRAAKTDYHA